MPAKRLDANFIKSGLHCPEHQSHIEYTDIARSGLYIEVRQTSPGQGTYWWRYKDDQGKTARVRIGLTTDVSLKDAKAQVRTLRAQRDLGRNPAAEIKAKKHSISWNEFWETKYLPHAQTRKRSIRNDIQMNRQRIAPRFGNTPLNKITKSAIQQFHDELGTSGMAHGTADHHLKLIRKALNLAVEWELLEKNPAQGIKQFNADSKVERYLSEDELQRLLKVLETDNNRTVCHVILFLLATGARLNEAISATWSNIDLENRVWVIEAVNSKSKKKRSVPLGDVAIDVLNALGTKGKHEHLFISPRSNQQLRHIGKVWQRIRKAADLQNFRLHDLRHSHASLLVNAGCTLYEVQQILGHADPTITQRYAHLSKESLQEAANTASAAISAAMKANGS